MVKIGDIVMIHHNHCCRDLVGLARVHSVDHFENCFLAASLDGRWNHTIYPDEGDSFSILEKRSNPFINVVGGI